MAKIQRQDVVVAALALLDEVGLDALSMRALAQKLGVESASLYWHFTGKAALLAEMSAAVSLSRAPVETPEQKNAWAGWFADNARAFRCVLLDHRDGARLHAGTTPSPAERARLGPKVAYLVRAGFAPKDALLGLFTTSQFTLGSVLEEQARLATSGDSTLKLDEPLAAEIAAGLDTTTSSDEAFERGLELIVDGLRASLRSRSDHAVVTPAPAPRRR